MIPLRSETTRMLAHAQTLFEGAVDCGEEQDDAMLTLPRTRRLLSIQPSPVDCKRESPPNPSHALRCFNTHSRGGCTPMLPHGAKRSFYFGCKGTLVA